MNKNNVKLVITLTPQEWEEVNSHVSIRWEDRPLDDDLDDEEFDKFDLAWTRICDGIHSLISNLGPIPETGWDARITCDNWEELSYDD